MSTDTATPNSLEGWLSGGFAGLPKSGIPWLDAEKQSALAQVRRQGIPSARQEDWRYTSLRSLTEQRFSPHVGTEAPVTRSDLGTVLVPGLDAHRAILVNGRFEPRLSDLADLPRGVRAVSLPEMLEKDPNALARHLNQLARGGVHLFSALNTAGMEDGLVLLVDRATTLDRPLEIIHLSVGADEPRVAQPRHLVVMGEGARVTMIERYLSLGDPLYCTNSLLELILEADASLAHHRIQTESPHAFHLSGLYLRLAQGSRYQGLNLGLGGTWSRTDLVVRFTGPHANVDLMGLFLAGDGQMVDYHLDVDHRLPHCSSREGFKGIVYGKGRAVFDGRIHVARDAHKTDAHLSNKNLLLSRSAEVDTKPQLEIFADDVKCSHGTTVGQLDPEALFYLRSRGISAPLARRMLCLGFAAEITETLDPEPLRNYVAEQVAWRLERATLT